MQLSSKCICLKKKERKKENIYIYIYTKGKDRKRLSSEERDVGASYGQKPAAHHQGMWWWDPSAILGSLRAFRLWFREDFSSIFHSLHYHFLFCFTATPPRTARLPMMQTQRQDAGDGCR